MEVSAEEEVKQIEMGKPYVVILGAGASFAAFPDGDRHGRKLPLMNNLVETLGIEDVVSRSGLSFTSNNFEDIYSKIHKYPELKELREELEEAVYEYFREMELPDTPTIYDHLVLSLRDKDFIATFNWDPFLVQAIRRNGQRFKMPRVLFLHGNVEVGDCPKGHMMGINGNQCHECHDLLTPTKLLYPVSEKNYHLDDFISKQWSTLDELLKHTFMVSIFGYGAPVSDASAIDLLKKAWGSVDSRNMEEIEIIDIRDEDDLRETWSPFIHTHHYRVEKDFYSSWIANHPRRTGEAYINQFLKAQFIENNSLPRTAHFEELWDWYDRLQTAENLHVTSG
ncbi:hypothetical protein [Marinobacter sp. CA1]|uniref:hypothetical protein n=1 Tax=Marinobacter sp. CA1 TaxID=2817656 RepID=UPI001D07A607|nr:hypothetical protein [Marinobacter sp. CA1]UDL05074.1 hypothetical protein J2887_20855 [Marinobacter sp. CA1]